MKMRLDKVRVDVYKSGPHEGELRTFDLPEGAQVVRMIGLHDGSQIIYYVVPA